MVTVVTNWLKACILVGVLLILAGVTPIERASIGGFNNKVMAYDTCPTNEAVRRDNHPEKNLIKEKN